MRLHTTNINFITLIILISLLFLLYSCNYNYPKYEHEVLNIIHHKQDLTEKDFLIVIPGEGCGGCISSATTFLIENQSNFDNSIIIFTGVLDKKLLRNQVGKKFLDKDNVIIDVNNLLMSLELKSVYPYYFKIVNSKLINKSNFSKLITY